jgi:HEAT repeat protein
MAQALGKIRDREVVPYLIETLNDPSFFPQDEAAWSLARLGLLAVDDLIAYYQKGRIQASNIALACLALGNSRDKAGENVAVHLLKCELSSGDLHRQRNAAYSAGEIVQAPSSQQLIAPLHALLEAQHPDLISVCCWALGCYSRHYPEQINWMRIAALTSENDSILVRFEATVAIGKYAHKGAARQEAVTTLLDRLTDGESRVRYAAMQSLRLLVEAGVWQPNASLYTWKDDDFGVMYELSLIVASS